MRKYLAQLHKKPDHHKRQFALLASGTITLFIFGIWSLTTFGVNRGMAANNNVSNVSVAPESEAGPFQSFRSSVAASLEAIKSSFGQLQNALKEINFSTEYQEMKDGALKTYGQ